MGMADATARHLPAREDGAGGPPAQEGEQGAQKERALRAAQGDAMPGTARSDGGLRRDGTQQRGLASIVQFRRARRRRGRRSARQGIVKGRRRGDQRREAQREGEGSLQLPHVPRLPSLR